MTAAEPLLRLEDVTKVYGDDRARVNAVSDVSLSLARGEFVLVMGPSGAGKSTLLQICGALLRPTAGCVWLDGTDIAELTEKRLPVIRLRKIGFVFQAFQLLANLTALENVRLVVEAAGGEGAGERARQLLAELDLEDRLHARPATLSGGEKQRVAVARALANDPPLILADEPTGNLDSKTGAAVMNLLSAAVRERGKGVLCVTHDHRVRDVADRVLWIEDGRLKPEGEYGVTELRQHRFGGGKRPMAEQRDVIARPERAQAGGQVSQDTPELSDIPYEDENLIGGPIPEPGFDQRSAGGVIGGPVLDHVAAYADALCRAESSCAISTYPGHHPDQACALDILVSSAYGQMPSDFSHGDRVANFTLENWASFSVTYIIWRQRINSNDGRGWRAMEDRGSITQNHFDHCHVSFQGDGSLPILTEGDRGPAVTRLQELLNHHGFQVDVDGIFGPQAAGAVVAFQNSAGLDPDGVVGPLTWAALGG